MHRLRALLVAASIAAALVAMPASASGGDGGAAVEDRELAELGRTAESLAAGACPDACRALEAMSRSASRLCALDGGARCAQARSMVADARAKVEARCGACPEPLTDEAPRPAPVAKEDERDRETVSLASEGPPAERKRGGCAACAVGERSSGGAGARAVATLSLAALVAIARRRRRDQCTR